MFEIIHRLLTWAFGMRDIRIAPDNPQIDDVVLRVPAWWGKTKAKTLALRMVENWLAGRGLVIPAKCSAMFNLPMMRRTFTEVR